MTTLLLKSYIKISNQGNVEHVLCLFLFEILTVGRNLELVFETIDNSVKLSVL